MQEVYPGEERVVAIYTRVINGFLSDEVVVVNPGFAENGSVERQGNQYTVGDLEKIPDIGGALASMRLSELKPTHIEITDELAFVYSRATGAYRKVDGKVYGIIRVTWSYRYVDISNTYQMDDLYYLYDSDGNGSIAERDTLRALLGDDKFIQSFSYDEVVAWD